MVFRIGVKISNEKFKTIQEWIKRGLFDQAEVEIAKFEENLSSLSPKELVLLGVLRAEILLWQGATREAIYLLSALLDEHQNRISGEELLLLFVSLAKAYINNNNFVEAEEIIQRALDFSRSLNAGDSMSGEIYLCKADIAWRLGRLIEGLEYAEQSKEYFVKAGNSAGLASALNRIATLKDDLAASDKAKENYFEAIEIANQEGKDYLPILAKLYNNLGNYYLFQGLYQNAIMSLEKALVIKQGLGLRLSAARTMHSLGEVYLCIEEYELAEEYFMESLETMLNQGFSTGVASNSLGLAVLHARRGNFETSEEWLRLAEEAVVESQQKELEIQLHVIKGMISQLKLDLNDALSYYQHAQELSLSLGFKFFELQAMLGSAETYLMIYRVTGEEVVLEGFKSAIEQIVLELKQRDNLRLRTHGMILRGIYEVLQGDSTKGRELLMEARRSLKRMGLTRVEDQLDRRIEFFLQQKELSSNIAQILDYLSMVRKVLSNM